RVGGDGGVRLRTALARQGFAELALEVVGAVAVRCQRRRLGGSRIRTFRGYGLCGHGDLLGSGVERHSLSCRARCRAPTPPAARGAGAALSAVAAYGGGLAGLG